MISEKEFKDIPPITLIYIVITGIVEAISNYYEDNTNFLKLIRLDYKKIMNNYEVWRLITNFFYIGKISPQFFFKFLLYFRRMKSTENKFKKKKKLAEFIMMLIYLMIIIHICNFIGYYYLKLKINSFLSHQLMFSIILINSKREPTKLFRFYFIHIENRYVPIFLFTLRAAKNRDKMINHIISFVPGLAYYWLKDVAPVMGLINDVLVTPKFLVDFIEENYYKRIKKKKKKNHTNVNNQQRNTNGNIRESNNNTNRNNSNNNHNHNI